MPNHVYNEITLVGLSREEVAPKVLNEKGEIDFSVLLPLPLNFWAGSVSVKHEKAFPGTHLAAARAKWGTKWGPYGDPKLTEIDGNVVLTFKTAWNHPRGWVCALFNTFNCEIRARWLSEGYADGVKEHYLPTGGLMDGPSWDNETIPEGSDEHKELHLALWGVEEFEDDDEDDEDFPVDDDA